MLDILKRKLYPFVGYRGGIFDCDCACADYSGVAAASAGANAISEKLGTAQLDEAKRQYDLNYATAKPIIDAQTGLMNQTMQQGDEYFNYWKDNAQPVENALNAQAMQAADPAYAEEMASLAMSDARQGTTAMQNQMIRQGLRYGYSPAKLAQMAGSMAVQQGLGLASAANQARQKQKDLGYAKQMDVAGLYRGMPGASQGAYGLALNSGNSAVNNQMQPGNSLMTGMAQGTGTIQNGLGMQINGLLGAANGQQAYYNAMAQNSGGGLGALLGAAGQIGAAGIQYGGWFGSDRRLKEDITLVGRDDNTGLNLYRFSYKDDPESRRFVGVMADEVESVIPEAVTYDADGYAMVNYELLGFPMVEV